MTNVRELMNPIVSDLQRGDSIAEAARRMARDGVGALPIRAADGTVQGMLTDRDIVVQVVATDRDPHRVSVGELAQSEIVTAGPDEPVVTVLARMTTHRLTRLPVVDGTDLVGIITLADVAGAVPDQMVGETYAGTTRRPAAADRSAP
jgi:CBS domain-containing protein